jgi:hypothetical protein
MNGEGDRSGWPQPAPPEQSDILVNALIADIIITAGAAVLLVYCYRWFRRGLDRHRLTRWAWAWAAIGPQWTSHQ